MFKMEEFMNTVITSREAILQTCREMVAETGLDSLNMRAVARECGVALGSIYNYFSSKEELVTAVIESVWQDIFRLETASDAKMYFPDYVQWIFTRIRTGMMQYPNFFTAHSIGLASDARSRARETMENYFLHMKNEMLEVLQGDEKVGKEVFTDMFSRSELIDFVLTSLLSLLVQQKKDCRVLVEVIRRTIYIQNNASGGSQRHS